MADRISTEGKIILVGMHLKISPIIFHQLCQSRISASLGFKDLISLRLLMQHCCSSVVQKKMRSGSFGLGKKALKSFSFSAFFLVLQGTCSAVPVTTAQKQLALA